MHDDDVLFRERDAGIDAGNARIPPARDLAEENVGQNIRCETHGLCNALEVVGRDHGAQHSRNVQGVAADGRDGGVGHGRVGAAEVDRLVGELADAAARADRLIVDLDVVELLVVRQDPRLIDDVRERGPRAVETHLCRQQVGGSQRADDAEGSDGSAKHGHPP